MANYTKAAATPAVTISQFVDITETIDAADFTTPFGEVDTYLDRAAGVIQVSDADDNVKDLNTALTVSSGVTKTITSPGGDERLEIGLSAFGAASGGSAGTIGAVPAPAAGEQAYFLRGDSTWVAAPGTGTVTSIALSMPSEFSVSGSPITASGTLTVSKANQSANLVAAGPSSGAAAAWAFRSLVADDLPQLPMDVLTPLTALGSDSSSIDIASVGTPFSTAYNHLMIYLRLRSDAAATSDIAYMEINGDAAAANYASTLMYSNGVTVGQAEEDPGTSPGIYIAFACGDSAPSNNFADVFVLLSNYSNTSYHKMMVTDTVMTLTSTALYRQSGAGRWLSTSAIQYLVITPDTGTNWLTGSAYAVYGIGS